jgi:hypothetical protein
MNFKIDELFSYKFNLKTNNRYMMRTKFNCTKLQNRQLYTQNLEYFNFFNTTYEVLWIKYLLIKFLPSTMMIRNISDDIENYLFCFLKFTHLISWCFTFVLCKRLRYKKTTEESIFKKKRIKATTQKPIRITNIATSIEMVTFNYLLIEYLVFPSN